jgi:hypothetical protein
MSTYNNQYGKEVKPIWKDKAAESQKIMKLSGAKLQSMVTNNLCSCTALTLSDRGITKLEDFNGFSDVHDNVYNKPKRKHQFGIYQLKTKTETLLLLASSLLFST